MPNHHQKDSNTFCNIHNIISAYIWTKLVDAKTIYGHRLTAQCPTDKVNDPVLYPGWQVGIL